MAINKVEANGRTLMDLTSDTVTPETLAEGVTAHDASGKQITGTATIGRVIELGLKVDFINKTFTRLGDAVGRTGGEGFDHFPMYKRRRCNVSNNGTVLAYYGDSGYSDSNNINVFVEQPKFYYKVVVPDQSESNKWIRYPSCPGEIEYWISDKPLSGYKLHPAFYNTSLQEIDNFYEGAYEGFYNQGTSNLQTVSSQYPDASTRYNRATFRNWAASNRSGAGWIIETIWSYSADLLLMIIEYGTLNLQSAIGLGKVESSKYSATTGSLKSYGNGTYGNTSDQTECVQWRGKENPWGNTAKWIDGINLSGRRAYIATDYNFSDNKYTDNYSAVAFYIPTAAGYISAFGYDSNFDYLFLPYQTNGTSALPVGDYCLAGNGADTGDCIVGGYRGYEEMAGPFFIKRNYVSSDIAKTGARLLYVG